MDPNMYLILAVIISGFAVTLYLLRRWSLQKSQLDPTLTEWLKVMNESVRGSSTDMTKVLQENTRQVNQRLDNAAQVIAAVQKNLGEMSEVGRSMKSLQDLLSSPKLRGGLGEEILNDMLGQSFPKNKFHIQYPFKSGNKVDVAIETEGGILCVDSKFPMENFNRMLQEGDGFRKDFIADVKKHISDIARKYILPDENTTDFALMYIPSESVYYEIANTPEIMKFARSARVYPVSPSTFYAHLQLLLVSFQGKDLESKSKQVFQLLRAIQKDYSKVEENLAVLGKHVTNANNQMTNVTQSFGLMGQKLSSTERLGDELVEETKQLEI